MNKSYESKYHRLEEEHWWFKTRRDIIIRLLEGIDKTARILDVGCSRGSLLRALQELGYTDVQGVDISKEAIDRCRRDDISSVYVMDAAKLTFTDKQFDVVIASDLLEHVKEEEMALTEWRRVLKPGGKLIIFVPAFGCLWSKHDEANHHYRRYTKSQLVETLEKAKFTIDRSSYWNFMLFFPTGLIRLVQAVRLKGAGASDDQLIELGSGLNTFLTLLVKMENVMLSKTNFPVGVSVFAITRKENVV